MSTADKSRPVIIYGADERIGQALLRLDLPTTSWLPRSLEFFEGKNIPKAILADIRDKQPSAVVNCLADPSSGRLPAGALASYVVPTHSILQQCRVRGIRYIQCSSARVFGQQEIMVGREMYAEYDPAVGQGNDPWRDTLLAMEQCLWQQTSLGNTAAMMSTKPGFEFYLLRLGELLSTTERGTAGVVACPLDIAIDKVLAGERLFYCDDPDRIISPIDVDTAAVVIGRLAETMPRARSGIYHIGSHNPVTIQELFHQIAIWTGQGVCVGADCATKPGVPHLYGLDSDQAISSEYWQAQSGERMPNWDTVLRFVLSRRSSLSFS